MSPESSAPDLWEDMLRVEIKKPSECSSDEIEVFEKLVAEAGEVQTEGLRTLVLRAERLVFLYSGDKELAGIAAIKRPNEGYKRKVFRQAKSQEIPNSYTYELGWVVVTEAFRGLRLSCILVEAALTVVAEAKIYATTRTDNEPMLRTNVRYGFHVSGDPYLTNRQEGNHSLSLFVRG
jgi:predicted GNAT family N-acyltransferase